MSDGPATPKRISKDVGVSIGQVSRVLKELVEMRLVEEMTGTGKGNIFEIKYNGHDLLDEIEKVNVGF